METTFEAARRLVTAMKDGQATRDSASTALLALKDQWQMMLEEAERVGNSELAWRAWRNVGHAKLVLMDLEAVRARTMGDVIAALAGISDEARLSSEYSSAWSEEERRKIAGKLSQTYDMPLPRALGTV